MACMFWNIIVLYNYSTTLQQENKNKEYLTTKQNRKIHSDVKRVTKKC